MACGFYRNGLNFQMLNFFQILLSLYGTLGLKNLIEHVEAYTYKATMETYNSLDCMHKVLYNGKFLQVQSFAESAPNPLEENFMVLISHCALTRPHPLLIHNKG